MQVVQSLGSYPEDKEAEDDEEGEEDEEEETTRRVKNTVGGRLKISDTWSALPPHGLLTNLRRKRRYLRKRKRRIFRRRR